VVALLVDTPLYNPTSRGSLTYCSRPHYGTGVGPSSNRHEYQEYELGVKTAGA